VQWHQDANGITPDGAIQREADFQQELLLEVAVWVEDQELNAGSTMVIKLFVQIKLLLILVVDGSPSQIQDVM